MSIAVDSQQAEPTVDFSTSWSSWHKARLRQATAEFGTASLAQTHWQTPDATSYEGAPGVWRADGEVIVGEGLGDGAHTVTDASGAERLMTGQRVALAPGDNLPIDGVRLRAMLRDGSLALRVFDPNAETRTSIADIDAFAPDAAWVLTGRFRPSQETVSVTAIDGHVSERSLGGVVELSIAGTPVELAVVREGAGYHAVFADGNSGSTVYRFRFLTLAEPQTDGTIVADFNRAYLPPCAFSDHYVCPLPLPSNRWSVPVSAGEKQIVRR